MVKHPDVVAIVERVRKDEIGGAADTAKEVIDALAKLVGDSQARDVTQLVAEVDEAVLAILRVMPSLAPPINALHRFVGTMERAEAEGAPLADVRRRLQQARDEFFAWAEGVLTRVAQYGAEKVPDGGRVFMYSMSSTVWRDPAVRQSAGQGV